MNKGRFGLAVLAGALATLGAAPVQAQSSGKAPEAKLEEITVTADRKKSFGANYVQAGSFRSGRLIDTPLSISVIPRELLDAQQAVQLLDALKNTAGVTTAQINSAIYNNLASRGIVIDNRANYRLNSGLPVVNLIDLPIEDKDRVEILKGVSALYYGFTTPSGIVNMTMKRAGAAPVTNLTIQGNGFGAVGAHVDVGRKFLDDKLGVRVNALVSDVDIGVERTDGRRYFTSLAGDYQATETLKFSLDLEYIDKSISEPNTWLAPAAVNNQIILPPIPDAKQNLAAKWMYGRGYEYNIQGTAEWRFQPNWALLVQSGSSYNRRDRYFSQFQNYNLATGQGTLAVTLTNGNINQNVNYRSEINGVVVTGPLKHELAFGFVQNRREAETPSNPTVNFAQNFLRPIDLPLTALPARTVPNPNSITDNGYYVFDKASFDTWLQLLVGVRYTDYSNIAKLTRQTLTTTSPAGGIVIKPWSFVSIYGTYIEGLEEGGIAPATALNSGTVLPANTSTQHEVGVKVEPWTNFLATAAYFDIDRPSSFVNSQRLFVQDGRVGYRGLELSLTGEIFDNLSVYSTAMFLDAKQKNAANILQINRRPENTPRFTGSVFLEYRTPFIEGLSVSGGVFFVGDRAINALNQAFVPSYKTFDLGARYSFEAQGIPMSARLYAVNVTNEHYWEATASSLLGKNLPPVVRMSVEARF